MRKKTYNILFLHIFVVMIVLFGTRNGWTACALPVDPDKVSITWDWNLVNDGPATEFRLYYDVIDLGETCGSDPSTYPSDHGLWNLVEGENPIRYLFYSAEIADPSDVCIELELSGFDTDKKYCFAATAYDENIPAESGYSKPVAEKIFVTSTTSITTTTSSLSSTTTTIPTGGVVWTELVGVSAAGNTIKSTTAGWGNSGAASVQIITGDGGVNFRADETDTSRMCGLSIDNIDADYDTIDYAIFLLSNGTVNVYERGVYIGQFKGQFDKDYYEVEDRFSIERVGSFITYKWEGWVFYTHAISSSDDLLVDAAIYTKGGTIADAKFISTGSPTTTTTSTTTTITVTSTTFLTTSTTSTTIPPSPTTSTTTSTTSTSSPTSSTSSTATTIPTGGVVWTDLVGVTATGNTITKSAPTLWGNGGAASVQTISGDGGVDFRADETDTNRMCGLSATNSDADYASIGYAIFLLSNGTVNVYEGGVYKGQFVDSYSPGDRFSVKRAGSVISYKRNGSVFYTSATPSSGDLLVDAALYANGGTIADAKFISASSINAAAPAITGPTPGSMLSGTTETFSWTTNGLSVSEWFLYVGSSIGGSEFYDSGSLEPGTTSVIASGLPMDGGTLYVRLWYLESGRWNFIDVTYTAATPYTRSQHGSISGVVSDDTGDPIENARVCVNDVDESGIWLNRVACGTTDSEGHYQVLNLLVGWYGVELFVDRDARSDMFYPDAFIREDATLVEVVANNDTGGINFEF